jgi:sulfite exporter TauE/SafE
MIIEALPIVALGFSLGLMHALDADHVMAVSALSNSKPSLKTSLLFCSNWALGHAGVLLLSGVLLFGLGLHLPEEFIYLAEVSVGLILIILGLLFFWRIKSQAIRLDEHHHGEVVHRHWHAADHSNALSNGASVNQAHKPVMVGMLHGFAGSAPALALVPAVSQGNLSLSLAYLAVFSLGVMLSMLLFGLGLGCLQQHLQQRYVRLFNWHRYIIASLSVMVGSYWLVNAI